jgi:hypothetical protein
MTSVYTGGLTIFLATIVDSPEVNQYFTWNNFWVVFDSVKSIAFVIAYLCFCLTFIVGMLAINIKPQYTNLSNLTNLNGFVAYIAISFLGFYFSFFGIVKFTKNHLINFVLHNFVLGMLLVAFILYGYVLINNFVLYKTFPLLGLGMPLWLLGMMLWAIEPFLGADTAHCLIEDLRICSASDDDIDIHIHFDHADDFDDQDDYNVDNIVNEHTVHHHPADDHDTRDTAI